MTDGVFVAFEGLDGSGTTTQAARAEQFVAEETDRTSARSAEPTDGPIGTEIRRCLAGEQEYDAETLGLLFAADRLEHLRTEIEPALAEGAVVLVDRYAMSSFAYQYADGVDADWLRAINRQARTPDLTIFLDVPPGTCLDRLAADDRGGDRFERKETLAAVYDAYQTAIEAERDSGNDVRVVDGTASEEQVAATVAAELRDYL